MHEGRQEARFAQQLNEVLLPRAGQSQVRMPSWTAMAYDLSSKRLGSHRSPGALTLWDGPAPCVLTCSWPRCPSNPCTLGRPSGSNGPEGWPTAGVF